MLIDIEVQLLTVELDGTALEATLAEALGELIQGAQLDLS